MLRSEGGGVGVAGVAAVRVRPVLTYWDVRASSAQFDTGGCRGVAEQLPEAFMDALYGPAGDVTVTKDEEAWYDENLNATMGGHPDFTEENWEAMRQVIRRCGDCFAKPKDIVAYIGNCPHPTFSIPFGDESKAAYQRPRKYSPGEHEIIDMHCTELLEYYDFIEPASKHCRHASNVVVAGKKDHATGKWTSTRFCVDMRMCNALSKVDNTLPPRPEDLYQDVTKAKFKTTLDATKAFHQIPLATEEDRDKTVFWWGNELHRRPSAKPYVQELPRLKDKSELRSILGLMNYYKGLVGEPGGPSYNHMVRPLNDLLQKDVVDVKGA
ncbi:hypothetical protein CYMTET_52534 [Cymbomonas tetramitiformis]|uniref:Reverse transcriptase domain-containing protein n=1 Tax=Cymbomonas tetramitiformis TaxID=36881 RepID=A0AAE0BJZ7_9CHLO|nr:hypothetical protein CYMTET_52534 [Cymbomonas tetramitiformis]